MADQSRNQYQPDWVTPPGATVAEMLEHLGMTQTELARRTGRPIKTINEIVKGKSAITPETALQLEKVLGVTASFWNNAEKLYRESLARQAESEALRGMAEWAKRFPVKQMVSYGWMPKADSAEGKVRNLLQFFGVASPTQYDRVFKNVAVAFRKSQKVKTDADALNAWLHQGTRVAQSQNCARFDGTAFKDALAQIRSLTTKSPEQFEPELKRICADCGVIVALVRELPGAPVNGAARWLSKDKACLQLSLRYKTNDIFWFSLFHEACHILYHRKRESFVDLPSARSGTEEEEREAHAFAEDILVPRQQYAAFVQAVDFRRERVVGFAEELDVAPGVIVGRLQHDGYVPYKNLNGLKVKLRWKA
jgi:HTH-type transcriptional regulator/antitoxin HigA